MSPFDKLFQAQVDKLLSANNKRRAFFFRGFLPKQIEFLIRHKTSLYMNEDFIEDDCLQIQKIFVLLRQEKCSFSKIHNIFCECQSKFASLYFRPLKSCLPIREYVLDKLKNFFVPVYQDLQLCLQGLNCIRP